jgi:hypothetical protein
MPLLDDARIMFLNLNGTSPFSKHKAMKNPDVRNPLKILETTFPSIWGCALGYRYGT